jgi:Ca2+-binding RTX toxin-like protein
MDATWLTDDQRLKLTQVEIDVLGALVTAGDRAAFYLAYYAMTGETEALVTSKISTFSDTVGGGAMAGNWFPQDAYRNALPPAVGTVADETYKGIWFLSQKVALSAVEAIKNDLAGTLRDSVKEKGDVTFDGLVSQNRFFISAYDAWLEQKNATLFPAQLLIYADTGQWTGIPFRDYSYPDWNWQQAQQTAGFTAALRAAYFGPSMGKKITDFPTSAIVDGPAGVKMAIDSQGRVEAVFTSGAASPQEEYITAIGAFAAQVVGFAQSNPGIPNWATAVFSAAIETAGIAYFGDRWSFVKGVWQDCYINHNTYLAQLYNIPESQLSTANLSAIRAGFSAFNTTTYNGDLNPNNSLGELPAPTYKTVTVATQDNDLLYIIGQTEKSGEGGNDLIFGDTAWNKIKGGTGNDIIWGKAGEDTLAGEAGDDILRGGVGNDILSGNAGNDILSGGDLVSSTTGNLVAGSSVFILRDGYDTVDYRTATVPVVIDLQAQDPAMAAKRALVVAQDGDNSSDTLHSIERILLTRHVDNVIIRNAGLDWLRIYSSDPGGSTLPREERTLLIDGWSDTAALPDLHNVGPVEILDPFNPATKDVLDFSTMETGVVVAAADTPSLSAIEIFSGYQPGTTFGQWVWNVFVPSSYTAGAGLYGATGLQFTNFEYVIGSAHDDILALRQLNPNGVMTVAEQAILAAAKAVAVSFSSGNPATIAAATAARAAAAGVIDNEAQDVVIEGGGGDDLIFGTATGTDRIYGGADNDQISAGSFQSTVYGGAGTDYVVGGGFQSWLYGDGPDSAVPVVPAPGGSTIAASNAPDIFGLVNGANAMDMGTDDYAMWGGFRLTGGVQQWWQEGQWAYWAPFSSLLSSAPLPAAS